MSEEEKKRMREFEVKKNLTRGGLTAGELTTYNVIVAKKLQPVKK